MPAWYKQIHPGKKVGWKPKPHIFVSTGVWEVHLVAPTKHCFQLSKALSLQNRKPILLQYLLYVFSYQGVVAFQFWLQNSNTVSWQAWFDFFCHINLKYIFRLWHNSHLYYLNTPIFYDAKNRISHHKSQQVRKREDLMTASYKLK